MTEKNRAATFDDIVAASVPDTVDVECGDFIITCRELSGAERFEAATRSTENRWTLMLWMLDCAIVAPRHSSMEQLERMRPEWVVKCAKAVMKISGMDPDQAEVEEAENE